MPQLMRPTRRALLLLAPAIKRVRQVTDWEQYGGAPILGFDKDASAVATARAAGAVPPAPAFESVSQSHASEVAAFNNGC